RVVVTARLDYSAIQVIVVLTDPSQGVDRVSELSVCIVDEPGALTVGINRAAQSPRVVVPILGDNVPLAARAWPCELARRLNGLRLAPERIEDVCGHLLIGVVNCALCY